MEFEEPEAMILQSTWQRNFKQMCTLRSYAKIHVVLSLFEVSGPGTHAAHGCREQAPTF